MNDQSTLPPRNHNNPPGPFVPDDLMAKMADFTDAAGAWLDLAQIDSEERAQRATDFVRGAREVHDMIDIERKRQKRPHDDAAAAVQAMFTPLMTRVKMAQDRVAKMQANWLTAERDRKLAEQRKAAAEARARAEEAARQAAAAEARNDIAGIVDAEAARAAAEKAEREAARVQTAKAGSATGGGRAMALRTTWFAEVANISVAFLRYRDHPEVRATLERLATAEVRSQTGEKTALPGFTFRKEEKAA
jgi:hypothetical protein